MYSVSLATEKVREAKHTFVPFATETATAMVQYEYLVLCVTKPAFVDARTTQTPFDAKIALAETVGYNAPDAGEQRLAQ